MHHAVLRAGWTRRYTALQRRRGAHAEHPPNPGMTPEAGHTVIPVLQGDPCVGVSHPWLCCPVGWAVPCYGASTLTVCLATWPPSTRCQQHPHQLRQPQVSAKISRCPLGTKLPPLEPRSVPAPCRVRSFVSAGTGEGLS
uniref:Uncharacterized protein n=1 Tax=Molossus molossus TaxID=27622 RepID=A0A7J8HHF8_MOLMO|nr:hypothetical protein HJG59_011083 [Molossus molossus]